MASSLKRIIAEVAAHPAALDFDRKDLAREATELAATAIWEYMEAQVDPDNNPWLGLEPGYEAWKARHFPGRKMAELFLLMKDPAQLLGPPPAVSAREVEQTYGLTQQARLEAEWFQEGFSGTDAAGRARHQPPRRFYEFNQLAVIYLDGLFDRRFAAAIG